MEDWGRYPDPQCEALTRALADYHQIAADRILCSNGAADLIYGLVQSIKPRQALLLSPGFAESTSRYLPGQTVISAISGFSRKKQVLPDVQQLCEQITPDMDLIFFCNPNNPTGHAVPREQILQIAKRCEETATRLILDECFCDLLDHPEAYSVVPEAEHFPNLFILRAFTKTYAMAGLRLGYGICAIRLFAEAFCRTPALEHFRAGPGGRMRGTAGKRLFKREARSF